MKKYSAPEIDMLCVQTLDVITLSDGENGMITSFSFGDIIGGEAEGWTKK